MAEPSQSISSAQNQKPESMFPNKAARAALAKETIHRIVPSILAADTRARNGVQNANLFRGRTDLPRLEQDVIPSHHNPEPLTVEIVWGDTLSTAQVLRNENPHSKIAVLNMASPLQPGGGVLRGAKAQEEDLCMRSTLYPSLKHQWYRLPDDGIGYTPDILVFRGPFPELRMLEVNDRFYVDVITCAAVRMPDLVESEIDGRKEMDYADPHDEELMVLKIKFILRTAVKMKVKILILGAIGCGAYRNPIHRVAKMMRKSLVQRKSGRALSEDWKASGLEKVVFAILDSSSDLRVWKGFTDEFGQLDNVSIKS